MVLKSVIFQWLRIAIHNNPIYDCSFTKMFNEGTSKVTRKQASSDYNEKSKRIKIVRLKSS